MKKGSPIDQYYAKCLQSNLPAAMRVLLSTNTREPNLRAFQKKVKARFIDKTEGLRVRCSDKLVAQVIQAYRHYYREVLLSPKRANVFESSLALQICAIVNNFGIAHASQMKWEKLETVLAKEFQRRGYFSLFGRVAPFRSLLVWQSQKERQFKVNLISGVEAVKVVLLEDFVELGWLHFATFGRNYVGGWAKRDALYCVTQAYKHNFNSETFRVSYLTHEAQHFSDYKKFPGISQSDLEFRAKLAELSAAQRPARILKKLQAEARNDPSLPHCIGAHRILIKLGTARTPASVRLAARRVLMEHSIDLEKVL